MARYASLNSLCLFDILFSWWYSHFDVCSKYCFIFLYPNTVIQIGNHPNQYVSESVKFYEGGADAASASSNATFIASSSSSSSSSSSLAAAVVVKPEAEIDDEMLLALPEYW